jgi:hypothetical protein
MIRFGFISLFMAFALAACSCRETQKDGAGTTPRVGETLARQRGEAESARLFYVVGFAREKDPDSRRMEIAGTGADAGFVFPGLFTARCTDQQLTALCGRSDVDFIDENPERKFDLALKIRLGEISKTGGTPKLQITGRCKRAVTDSVKNEIVNCGATVYTVVDDIFTAECTVQALYKVGLLDGVASISLSGESTIK